MGATFYCADCLTTFTEDGARCPNLSCGAQRPAAGWGALLQPGDLLDRHYQVGRPLAVGGAGITYLAREVDGDGTAIPPELAIKVLYSSRATGQYLRRLANEAQILQELDHEHIVKCRGFVHRTGHAPYLVTLFEHGGNLAQHVGRVGPLSPRVAAATLRQVLLALDVAHQRGVVHRDLKPDNVLLRERVEAGEVPRVRVADFGIAKIAGGLSSHLTRVGTFLGTPEYAAPEQFRGETPTPATDVFAAGTLLFFLLTGRVPFAFSRRDDLETSYRQMLKAMPVRLELADADPLELEILQEILDHMGALEPDRRWTVHQVIARLSALVDAPTRAAYQTLDLTNRGAPTREHAPGMAQPSSSLHTMDDSRLDTPDPPPTGSAPSPTEIRAPKTAMPSSPPPSPPSPSPAPVREQGRGGAGLLGVLAGLGAAGLLATVVFGGALTVAVLAGTAWATGWLDAEPDAPVRLDPVVIEVPEPEPDLDAAVAWLGGTEAARQARQAVLTHLDGLGAALGAECGRSARVLGSLWIDAEGQVVRAQLDGEDADCLQDALQGERVPNPTGAPGRARVAFTVGTP